MKRFLFSVLLFFTLSISIPPASFAGGGRSITILYTGAVRGKIDPCLA